MSVFADRLKQLRRGRKCTQKEFADKIGVSQSTVGNWEAGRRIPNQNTLFEIANFFSVTPSFLLGWNESVNESVDESAIDKLLVHAAKTALMDVQPLGVVDDPEARVKLADRIYDVGCNQIIELFSNLSALAKESDVSFYEYFTITAHLRLCVLIIDVLAKPEKATLAYKEQLKRTIRASCNDVLGLLCMENASADKPGAD